MTSATPIDLANTVAPLRRGAGDPSYYVAADGAHWRTSRMASGPVTYRLARAGTTSVTGQAWGAGAEEFLDQLDRMLCLDQDSSDFVPHHHKVAEAQRRFPGLRMLRTGLVFEALVPAVLEQKVHTVTAHAAWRKLVRMFGDPPLARRRRQCWCHRMPKPGAGFRRGGFTGRMSGRSGRRRLFGLPAVPPRWSDLSTSNRRKRLGDYAACPVSASGQPRRSDSERSAMRMRCRSATFTWPLLWDGRW